MGGDSISPEIQKTALGRIRALRSAIRKLDSAVDHLDVSTSARAPDPTKLQVTLGSMKAPMAGIVENYLVLIQTLVGLIDAQTAWSELDKVGEANSKVTVKDLGIDPSMILPFGRDPLDPFGRGRR